MALEGHRGAVLLPQEQKMLDNAYEIIRSRIYVSDSPV